jgi:hypothetical protein
MQHKLAGYQTLVVVVAQLELLDRVQIGAVALADRVL